MITLNGEFAMVPIYMSNVPTRALGALAAIVCCTSCGDASKAGAPESNVQARSLKSGGSAVALAPRAPAAKARSTAAKPVKKPAKSTGAMSQTPIKLGYYVYENEPCEKPASVTKIEADGYWELSQNAAESFRTEFGEVTRSMEGGRASYFAEFGGKDAVTCDDDEPCNSGVDFAPHGADRLDITIQDTVTLRYCSPEKIPKSFRR